MLYHRPYTGGGTPPLVRGAFVLGVWMFVAWCVWRAFWNLRDPAPLEYFIGGWYARALMAPFVLGGMELLFWFRFFRHERDGARIFALMVAFFMGVILLVTVLTYDVGHRTVGMKWWWVYLYVGASHLAYGIWGRERAW